MFTHSTHPYGPAEDIKDTQEAGEVNLLRNWMLIKHYLNCYKLNKEKLLQFVVSDGPKSKTI